MKHELPSISHSRTDTLRRCHRKYHYSYNLKLEPLELTMPLRMGSAFSDGLEHWDVAAVDDYYAPLLFHSDNPSLLVERAKARVMVQLYMGYYDEPDEREVPFEREVNGYRDNGRFDGVEWDHVNELPILIEDKFKGRWGAPEVKSLEIDDQCTRYLANAAIKYDLPVMNTYIKYRVTVRPQHRLGKSETPVDFEQRLHEVVSSDMPRFFHEHIVTRSQRQVDEWFDELDDTIVDLSSITERNVWRRNPTSCGDFGGCEFIDLCTAADDEQVQAALQGLKPKEDQ